MPQTTNTTKAALAVGTLVTLAVVGQLWVSRPLDLTSNTLPVLIDKPTEYGDVVDNNQYRPTFLVVGPNGSLKVRSITRKIKGDNYIDPANPGLGAVYDGTFRPRLKIGFSHNDFDASAVVLEGSGRVDAKKIVADVCVSVISNYDGTYGKNSVVNVENGLGCRFVVLATGQENLTVNIGYAEPAIWVKNDSSIGGGHVLYCNESYRYDDLGNKVEYLRIKGLRAIIGKVRSVATQPGTTRVLASPSIKLKGTWDAYVEDLDDQNSCGAGDFFNSYGVFYCNWKHPGDDVQNSVFLGFRCGDQDSFGVPPGNLAVYGTFDHSKAPDQTTRAIALHTLTGHVFMTSVNLYGKAKADVYGVVNKVGLSESETVPQ